MSAFKDKTLHPAFAAMLTAMEDDFMKQGMSDKRAKIMVGSLLLTVGQSALIQAAQMSNIIPAQEKP